MEIARIKELKPTESAVLIFLIYRGICKARVISKNLEIDIYNLYRVLRSLEKKNFIIRIEKKNRKDYEYKVREDVYIK